MYIFGAIEGNMYVFFSVRLYVRYLSIQYIFTSFLKLQIASKYTMHTR
jgi:hypothetical protein